MRFTLALFTIGALLTGQLDSNPLSTVTTHASTHGTTRTTAPIDELYIKADAILNQMLNTSGESVINYHVAECSQELEEKEVLGTCAQNLVTEVPLHQLVNKSAVKDYHVICGELIQMAVCINEMACKVCKDYDEVLRFGDSFYQQSLLNAELIGCPEYTKPRCQVNLDEEQYKKIVQDDDNDFEEETGLSATHITIIVVIGLTLILGALVLYLMFFGPFPDAGDDEGKSAKEGPSEGPSKGAKSASAPKSTKVGEPSTKSKLPNVAKSTVKSAISGGAKSKVKSSVAKPKVSSKVKSTVSTDAKSKVKSTVAETKTASKVASKTKV